MLVPYLIVAGTGLLLMLVALPLWLQKISPNWLYGFRTPRTVSNAALWYAANKVTGQDLFLAGLAQILMSLAALALSLPEGFIAVTAVAPILVGVLHSLWVTSEVAYALDSGEGSSEAAVEAAEVARTEVARRASKAKTAA